MTPKGFYNPNKPFRLNCTSEFGNIGLMDGGMKKQISCKVVNSRPICAETSNSTVAFTENLFKFTESDNWAKKDKNIICAYLLKLQSFPTGQILNFWA